MPKISIIVPVYNVEKYIHQCVDSILNQTFKNFELILVDDGSPDNCGAICDAYARWDKRVKVIHQKNGGISAARNAGLRCASGGYICFVDSDDVISPYMYEILVEKAMQFNADIVKCGFKEFCDDRDIKEVKYEKEQLILNDLTNLTLLRKYFEGVLNVVVWNGIYSRELALKVFYPEGLINEDVYASGMYMYFAKNMVTLDKPLYFYRQNLQGLSKNVSLTKRPLDRFVCFSMLHEELRRQGLSVNCVACTKIRRLIAKWVYKIVKTKRFIMHMDKDFYSFVLENLGVRRKLVVMYYKWKRYIILR